MRVCEQLQRDPQPARGARHHVHPVHTCTAGAAAASRCDARVVAALWHDHSARGRTTRALVPRRRRAAQAARRLRLRRRALVRLGLPRRLHPVTIQQVAIDVVRHKLHYRDLLWICVYNGLLGSRVVSVLDSGAEGPGFKSQSRSCRVTVSVTVHTHCASVHQTAKLVAALLRVAGVTAGLAESNGSLPPGFYNSRHLQADCQEPGSAPEPYGR